jgi:hypothetical protein
MSVKIVTPWLVGPALGMVIVIVDNGLGVVWKIATLHGSWMSIVKLEVAVLLSLAIVAVRVSEYEFWSVTMAPFTRT